jgi:hypothetical protein
MRDDPPTARQRRRPVLYQSLASQERRAVLFFRKGAVMAETGRSSGKVKNPNADPRQKHSQHSPHSPRQNPGDGEVGHAGKDIPVNDMVSSNVKSKEPRSAGAGAMSAAQWKRQLFDIVRRKHDLIRELMPSRTTQTNESARCRPCCRYWRARLRRNNACAVSASST